MKSTDLNGVYDKRAAVIRDDHQTLYRLIDAAFAGLRKSPAAFDTAETVAALNASNRSHTFSEDLLMRLYQYPGHDQHGVQHGKLDQLAETLLSHYERGDFGESIRTLEAYAEAIRNHIETFDTKLSRYLEDVGAVVK